MHLDRKSSRRRRGEKNGLRVHQRRIGERVDFRDAGRPNRPRHRMPRMGNGCPVHPPPRNSADAVAPASVRPEDLNDAGPNRLRAGGPSTARAGNDKLTTSSQEPGVAQREERRRDLIDVESGPLGQRSTAAATTTYGRRAGGRQDWWRASGDDGSRRGVGDDIAAGDSTAPTPYLVAPARPAARPPRERPAVWQRRPRPPPRATSAPDRLAGGNNNDRLGGRPRTRPPVGTTGTTCS